MDKIKITGISVYAYHGVLQSEKDLGQTFYIDCEFSLDTSMCNDEIKKTVNYGEVSCKIASFCRENRFDLLETLANKLSKHLLLSYPMIEEITIKVHKPHAPISTPFRDVSLTITRKNVICYLGTGSNLGDREKNLLLVEEEINNDENITLLDKSSYIETEPYGVLDQPKFLNGVLKVRTVFTPKELLSFCKNIENKAGRIKTRHWGERTLDVDILFYGNEIYWKDNLRIPHPEISKREFVLAPFVEIEPYFIHPVEMVDMQTILERLNNK